MGYLNGTPDYLIAVYDSSDQPCGIGARADYPYLYFP